MEKHRVPICLCPNCGLTLDGASSVTDNGKPKPGDISICIECFTLLSFDQSLRLVEMTPDQFDELPPSLKKEMAINLNYLKHTRSFKK